MKRLFVLYYGNKREFYHYKTIAMKRGNKTGKDYRIEGILYDKIKHRKKKFWVLEVKRFYKDKMIKKGGEK